MPTPSPFRPSAPVRRRTALGGLLALGAVVTGCTARPDVEPQPRSSPGPATETDPDVVLAATVLTAEQEVLDLVRATLHRHRRLHPVLAATAAVHLQHTRLLEHAAPSDAPSPSARPTAPAHVPADPLKALAAVARAEDRLTVVDKRSAFSAESGGFARILASMAAAAAQQAALLRPHAQPGAAR